MCKILTSGMVEQFWVSFYDAFRKLNEDPKAYTYHQLITKADTLYQLLVSSKHWLAHSSDEETVLAGLVTKVDKLVMQGGGRGCDHGKGQESRRGRGTSGNKCTCFGCGKEGHFLRECPDKDKDTPLVEKRKMTPEAGGDKWKHTPPKQGDEHVQVKNGITWKGCGKCQRWTLSHTTTEHHDLTIANTAMAADKSHLASAADKSHLTLATGSVSCLTLGGF